MRSQGLAFVDDDDVRFQAPDEAGTYTAVYTIGDDFEQTARASVTFTVLAKTQARTARRCRRR